MKVCFVTYSAFHLGGVQRVLSVLTSELSKDIEVDILCNGEEFKVDRRLYNLNDNVNVIVDKTLLQKDYKSKIYSNIIIWLNKNTKIFDKHKPFKILKKAYCPKIVQKKFIKFFNEKNYDVIIGVEGNYSLLLASISDKLKSKTIGWQHNSFDAYFNTPNKYYWNQDSLFKNLIPKLNGYIVLTDHDKSLLKEKFNIDSISIYNPLSFQSKKKSKCIRKQIIFVGRIVEQQKGLDLLIKSFEIVAKKHSDWNLCIIGDGEDKDKLITNIEKANLSESVTLVNSTNKVEDFYIDSSIFVSSSRWEGFGLVIIEAMECGLPVIAFNNSGPKEIINKNKINGILVPHNDVNALAYYMNLLIEDDLLRKQIAKESIVRARDFNANKTARIWIEIFKKMNSKSLNNNLIKQRVENTIGK